MSAPFERQPLLVIVLCAAGAATVSLPTAAAPLDATVAPQQVTITATRVATPAFDVPASIDQVVRDPLTDDRPQASLSEVIGGLPGVLVRDRQNFAQDVQISVRGFGARSTFGVRGVRLYVDGIPATLPDGQGQISNVDFGSAAVVEVLRGPFSALYGNSSGGVVQVFSEEGVGAPTLSAGGGFGSDGMWRHNTKLSGASGNLSYLASTSHFQTEGLRAHSAAQRDTRNLKLHWRFDDSSRLTLIGNAFDLPGAQDPLGLSRSEYEADPRKVAPAAVQFNTRKSAYQTQAGLIYERRLSGMNTLRVLIYGGRRDTEQFQSIPVAAQLGELSPGGVIRLGRDYHGTDWRYTAQGLVNGQAWTLVSGLAYDRLQERRLGYQNFVGPPPAPQWGVQGALRRDEANEVSNLDPYFQGEWQPTPEWRLHAGVRRSSVRFSSKDAYIVGANPNDSGSAHYRATLPVLGVLYAWRPDVHLYATAGRGFETPTLNELAYRPSGETGMNFGLRPARSDSAELGLKTKTAVAGEFGAAVFATRTRDEIVTLSNSGGRASYQNVAATRRLGLELSWSRLLRRDWRVRMSYTGLDARYRGAFMTCTASPCAQPNVTIPAGNRIPGIARNALFGELVWAPAVGWRASVDARYLSRVWVDDANTDAAAGYLTTGVSAGYSLPVGAWTLSGFARIDNIGDARYAGSVIVNEGNGRYFEPAPGRAWFAGLNATYRF